MTMKDSLRFLFFFVILIPCSEGPTVASWNSGDNYYGSTSNNGYISFTQSGRWARVSSSIVEAHFMGWVYLNGGLDQSTGSSVLDGGCASSVEVTDETIQVTQDVGSRIMCTPSQDSTVCNGNRYCHFHFNESADVVMSAHSQILGSHSALFHLRIPLTLGNASNITFAMSSFFDTRVVQPVGRVQLGSQCSLSLALSSYLFVSGSLITNDSVAISLAENSFTHLEGYTRLENGVRVNVSPRGNLVSTPQGSLRLGVLSSIFVYCNAQFKIGGNFKTDSMAKFHLAPFSQLSISDDVVFSSQVSVTLSPYSLLSVSGHLSLGTQVNVTLGEFASLDIQGQLNSHTDMSITMGDRSAITIQPGWLCIFQESVTIAPLTSISLGTAKTPDGVFCLQIGEAKRRGLLNEDGSLRSLLEVASALNH